MSRLFTSCRAVLGSSAYGCGRVEHAPSDIHGACGRPFVKDSCPRLREGIIELVYALLSRERIVQRFVRVRIDDEINMIQCVLVVRDR